MSQITTGVRSILSAPLIYDLFQNFMGANSSREMLTKCYIKPLQGERVLDIGCGTARILDNLGNVEYFGFDLSPEYIKKAKERYSEEGNFKCAPVTDTNILDLGHFDIVLAIGLIHHLNDDDVIALTKLAFSALKTGGRFITVDPCFSTDQNLISKYLVSKDRGQNVRNKREYFRLLSSNFDSIDSVIRHQKWIPYTHCINVCYKN